MTAWSIKQIQAGVRQFEVVTVEGRMYSRDILEWFLDLMARAIPVDERYYRNANGDVNDAIERGEVPSGAAHFVEHGFYEDRCPCDVSVDEADYFSRYPDVAQAVKDGNVGSATDHWLKYGRFEGRRAVLNVGGGQSQASAQGTASSPKARRPKAPAARAVSK